MKISAINNTNNYQNKSFQAKFARSESLLCAFRTAAFDHEYHYQKYYGESPAKAVCESFLLAVKSLLENGSNEKINVHVSKDCSDRGERVIKRVITIARKRNPEFDSFKIEHSDGVMYGKNTVTPEELSAITPELDKLTQLDKTSPDVVERIRQINSDIEDKLHKVFEKNLKALENKIFNT